MYKYTIYQDSISGQYTVLRNSDNTQFLQESIDSDNRDYQQFLQDVKKEGLGIVQGPTVGVTTAYNIARQAEYPPIKDQLDKIYHSGVDAWKADIKAIKDKYPKSQVGVTTIAAVPDWVQTEVDKL
jgi:type IV secretory pathway VirJ component|tara:strand:- start:1765 stop:2142 length:378 start_codon:yes stop_codon:yes gene_type:complete